MQTVGRDTRGRKQYRYHRLYRQIRDENTFGRPIAFGEALPVLRASVKADIAPKDSRLEAKRAANQDAAWRECERGN